MVQRQYGAIPSQVREQLASLERIVKTLIVQASERTWKYSKEEGRRMEARCSPAPPLLVCSRVLLLVPHVRFASTRRARWGKLS